MLQKLKHRFVMLYTISAGAILLVTIVVIFLWTRHQSVQQQIDKLSLQMDRAVYFLQKSVMMNSTEFSMMEMQNHVMLHFEEKGKPLYYHGNYKTQKERNALFAQVKQNAEAERMFFGLNPSTQEHVKSSVYRLKGEDGSVYLGQAVILPTKSSWQSMTLVMDITEAEQNKWKDWVLFGMAGILSLTGLYLLSHFFVARTMKPVEEAQNKQTEFIAAASHELKSPLAVIKTCTSALALNKDRQEEFLSDIEAECSRMSKLVEELLLLASAETKTWTMRIEPVVLDNFLIKEYDHYAHILAAKQQELMMTLPDQAEDMVLADKNRLNQVLTILIDNASRYSDTAGRIELILESRKKSYAVKVLDHGCGIDDQQKEHIFERFYRGDKARSDKNHYGLGLSIGYELIRRMGGTLSVEDTNGGGATFVIELHRKDE